MKATLRELLKEAFIAGTKHEREKASRNEYYQLEPAAKEWIRERFGNEEIILTHRVDE